MTLLSYQLPVKWCKYQYSKLINEFLANFLLYLPYRKCFLNADLTYPAEEAAGVREIDKWPQREANECMRSATHNRQAVLVGGCLSARLAQEISVRSRRIYRTVSLDANEHYFAL